MDRQGVWNSEVEDCWAIHSTCLCVSSLVADELQGWQSSAFIIVSVQIELSPGIITVLSKSNLLPQTGKWSIILIWIKNSVTNCAQFTRIQVPFVQITNMKNSFWCSWLVSDEFMSLKYGSSFYSGYVLFLSLTHFWLTQTIQSSERKMHTSLANHLSTFCFHCFKGNSIIRV